MKFHFVNVQIFDQQQDLILFPQAVKKIVREVLYKEKTECMEVALHFVDSKTIAKLHERFFNEYTTTDCISFPIDEELTDIRVLGDVFVCPKTAIDYAQDHVGLDPYVETTLYIVHGLLHLIGFRDKREKERVIMRKKEQFHMENLKNQNLLLKPPPK